MHRSLAILLLITTLESGRAIAGTCSSRDGQKYCTCEFNQTCTSSENSCACVRDSGEPQLPGLTPPSARSTQQSVTRIPDPLRREPAPPTPAIIDNEERTPAEYLQLARTAIAAGKWSAAIEFIDKGQTRLLDRSVALNKTFDPIEDAAIKQLSEAKQALLSKNRERAMKSIDTALATMR